MSGDTGISNVVRRSGNETSAPGEATTTATASCLAGETAIGGGRSTGLGSFAEFHVIQSFPTTSTNPTAWSVRVLNGAPTSLTYFADVMCASSP